MVRLVTTEATTCPSPRDSGEGGPSAKRWEEWCVLPGTHRVRHRHPPHPVRCADRASPPASGRRGVLQRKPRSGPHDRRAHLDLRHHAARWCADAGWISRRRGQGGAGARGLDGLGIDYVEGASWPGANPTDDAFFAEPASTLKHARPRRGLRRMTRRLRPQRRQRSRPRRDACSSGARVALTLVGKAWDFHVKVALGAELGPKTST